MKKVVVAVMMVMILGSANAYVNGGSTLVVSAHQTGLAQYAQHQTSVNYYNAGPSENTITFNKVSNRVIEVVTKIDNKETLEINIIDMAGTTVYETTTKDYYTTIMLDESIAPGIYMIQIDAGKVQKTKRLVIQ